jgi:hypothetical protein
VAYADEKEHCERSIIFICVGLEFPQFFIHGY